MKSTPTCIPCYLRQALSASQQVTDDLETQRHIVNEVSKILPQLSLDSTPAYNSTIVLHRAQELLGCQDPFSSLKQHYNELALGMYSDLRALVESSSHRLSTAIRVAAAGNVIDLGILDQGQVDVTGVLEELIHGGLTVDEGEILERKLACSDRVLYLVDNAGETVFDRVLIEELEDLNLRTTVAVKGQPILNDATMDDALLSGLDGAADLISNGSAMIGTQLATCSPEFLDCFSNADLIISKGQANFETLNETSAPVFFILRAKCPEVARELGVDLGDIVVLFNQRPG